jgi:hypothetical protein
MRDHRNAKSFRRIPVVLVAALFVGANPALAADRTIAVSGDSVPSDCGAAKSPSSAVELSGSLVGCLAIFVQHFNCHAMNGFDFSTELGREEFEGTLDGQSIIFNTLYTFNAIWPSGSCPSPAIEAEVAGGCVHYVSGEGVSGVIRFYDIIPVVGKGATNFLYEGVLTVSDGGAAAIDPVVPPSLDLASTDTALPKGSLRPATSSC